MNVDLSGLPIDGPHTSDTVRDATYALGEIVRYLNYATNSAAVVSSGPVLFDAVSGIATAVQRLDQTVHQISTGALDLRVEPNLRDDRGDEVDPADTAEEVGDAVAQARRSLAIAARALQDAASAASHLGHSVDAEDAE